jgi:hypothetical protein
MATIKTYPLPNSSILRLNSEKDLINTAPEYQRHGGIWSLEKKQLLIDSIINDYDIPKLYFHYLTPQQRKESGQLYEYAIIDGRQRIEAIWDFIDGVFGLSEDFEYLADSTVIAGKLTYSDLAVVYPRIKIRFDSYSLPVILVETDDIDLIEDMFSRLNEAVPLNSAEKRNSFGGSMAKAIRELAFHDFFSQHVRFSNNRFQHREVAARILFIEDSLANAGKFSDTKKPFLDRMVYDYRDSKKDPSSLVHSATLILDAMSKVFIHGDALLRAQATITVYYLVFRQAQAQKKLNLINRAKLFEFFEELSKNRIIASKDITLANYDFLEFEAMSQQGTNDVSSIRERTRILCQFLGI